MVEFVDNKMNLSEKNSLKKIAQYHCPRYSELPSISLYMDQLIEFLDQYLSEFNIPEDEIAITPTMVNNYVKQRLISPPQNKRYLKEQVARLIVIGILKQVLSISDIALLLKQQIEQYSVPVAYDFFCVELENVLKATFDTRDFSVENTASVATPLSEVVHSALLSFSNKIYVKKNLYMKKEQDVLGKKDSVYDI